MLKYLRALALLVAAATLAAWPTAGQAATQATTAQELRAAVEAATPAAAVVITEHLDLTALPREERAVPDFDPCWAFETLCIGTATKSLQGACAATLPANLPAMPSPPLSLGQCIVVVDYMAVHGSGGSLLWLSRLYLNIVHTNSSLVFGTGLELDAGVVGGGMTALVTHVTFRAGSAVSQALEAYGRPGNAPTHLVCEDCIFSGFENGAAPAVLLQGSNASFTTTEFKDISNTVFSLEAWAASVLLLNASFSGLTAAAVRDGQRCETVGGCGVVYVTELPHPYVPTSVTSLPATAAPPGAFASADDEQLVQLRQATPKPQIPGVQIVDTPATLQQALEDGVEHVVVAEHLDFTALSPRQPPVLQPKTPREFLMFVFATTRSIQGNCSEPGNLGIPSHSVVMLDVLKPQCTLLISNSGMLFYSTKPGHALYVSSLYVRVVPAPTGVVQLVAMEFWGPMYVYFERVTVQNDGYKPRWALDVHAGTKLFCNECTIANFVERGSMATVQNSNVSFALSSFKAHQASSLVLHPNASVHVVSSTFEGVPATAAGTKFIKDERCFASNPCYAYVDTAAREVVQGPFALNAASAPPGAFATEEDLALQEILMDKPVINLSRQDPVEPSGPPVPQPPSPPRDGFVPGAGDVGADGVGPRPTTIAAAVAAGLALLLALAAVLLWLRRRVPRVPEPHEANIHDLEHTATNLKSGAYHSVPQSGLDESSDMITSTELASAPYVPAVPSMDTTTQAQPPNDTKANTSSPGGPMYRRRRTGSKSPEPGRHGRDDAAAGGPAVPRFHLPSFSSFASFKGGTAALRTIEVDTVDEPTSPRARVKKALQEMRSKRLLFLGRYDVLGMEEMRMGGQAMVQFMKRSNGEGEVAVKFFTKPGAFQTEVDLYRNHVLRSHMPMLLEHDANVDERVNLGSMTCPPYIITIRGQSLDEFMKLGTHDFITAIQSLTHVASVLARLHEAGIAHRDLKPGNVLRMPATHNWSLLDFGISAKIGAEAPLAMSLRYAAPEVVSAFEAGKKSVCVEASMDMWAFGVIAFELVSCTHVFESFTTTQEVKDRISGRSTLPWEQNDEASRQRVNKLRALKPMVLKCLARNPEQRPSAQEVVRAWDQLYESSSAWPATIRAVVASQPGELK